MVFGCSLNNRINFFRQKLFFIPALVILKFIVFILFLHITDWEISNLYFFKLVMTLDFGLIEKLTSNMLNFLRIGPCM